MWKKTEQKKVKCPHCGYEMPMLYDESEAICRGVFVKCKGRNCAKQFEIILGAK